jgi:hypothetical protein
MWLSVLTYWWAISRNVKETERRESAASRIARLVLIVGAAALLWLPNVPLPCLNQRFLSRGAWYFWSGAAVTAVGLLFAVWARRHLGKNWNQAVTVKEGHELITSGPPTPWFAIPSTPDFCWHFLVAQWPVASGAVCLLWPLPSSHYGANWILRGNVCARSSASRMKLTLGGWRRWCHMSSENDQGLLDTPLPGDRFDKALHGSAGFGGGGWTLYLAINVRRRFSLNISKS